MPMTKSWKKLNLFHWFYQVQCINPSDNSVFTYPLTIKITDGTDFTPKTSFNSWDHYNCAYQMYGMISNEFSNDKPAHVKGGFKIIIGSGTTRPTEDDYQMESPIATGDCVFKNEANRVLPVGLYFNGLVDTSICMEVAGYNNTNNTWNINEIGIYTKVAAPTGTSGSVSSSVIKEMLMFREVLSETIRVEPGKQYSIKFKLSI